RTNKIIGGMLWVKMTKGNVMTAIDLSALGLDKIEETENEFRIGCMASLRQMEEHQSLNAYTNGAIKEALRYIVGVQFRNLATVGGSVYGRFGFSDVLTVMLSMDTYVEMYKGGIIPLAEFVNMKYDRDILVSVIIKKQKASFCYQSVRIAKTDFPVLTCATALTEAGIRMAIGARPGKAMLLADEEKLVTLPITADKAKAFAEYAVAKIPTANTNRGSAEYRTHLVKVLAERTIMELGGKA
ncbi:MAG: FAD binding domain-containing protein, partial [Phascolarctobacterium sp.]|nr:FAD binding domain-containing protein [Phascolarctobacterium sp.]